MSGDLSVGPSLATLDLASSVRWALSGPGRPITQDGVSQPQSGAIVQTLAPAGGEQVEAARLKALLTDPEVQVSTHRDDASGRTVLLVQRLSTGDVVEQIPSEALLHLYSMLRESLVDERA